LTPSQRKLPGVVEGDGLRAGDVDNVDSAASLPMLAGSETNVADALEVCNTARLVCK